MSDINVHTLGTPRRIDGTFKNIADALQDPTTVKLRVKTPAGVVTEYTYPATVSKESTGKFYRDHLITAPGKWAYEWIGEGAASVEAAGWHLFLVEPIEFTVTP